MPQICDMGQTALLPIAGVTLVTGFVVRKTQGSHRKIMMLMVQSAILSEMRVTLISFRRQTAHVHRQKERSHSEQGL
jgi:ABC-type transport system involved in cytochrome c biogenesis permease subunit